MKKITSVFITAMAFVFSFMNINFAESKSIDTNDNQIINRGKKEPSGKIANPEQKSGKETNLEGTNLKGTNLEGTNLKGTNLEAGKVTDLGKTKLTSLEQVKGTNLEAVKLTDLEKAKLTDLERAKLTDLEKADKSKGTIPSETLKVENLDRTNIKTQDLENKAGANLPAGNVEKKR